MARSDEIGVARNAFDAEIQRYESLRARRRNALVNSIPPEILLEIFAFIVANHKYDLVCTASVCRRWRTIAINHSSLWTSIDFRKPQWHLNLERAKDAPLSLMALEPSSDFVSFYDVLLQNAYRVIRCELFLAVHQFDMFFNAFRGNSFPRLEILNVSYPVADRTGIIPTLDVHMMPVLQHLKLTNVNIAQNFPLPGLTHLILRFLANKPPNFDIYQLLKNTPLLQSLDLAYVVPQCPEASRSSCLIIPLTHLSCLRLLDNNFALCAHFTTHIAFPRSADVCIFTGAFAPVSVQEVLDTWDVIVPIQYDDRKYQLAVYQKSDGSVNMTLKELDQPEVLCRVVGFQVLSDAEGNNSLQRVCRQTIERFRHITHLEFRQGRDNPTISWRELFDGMNELVYLCVTRRNAAAFDDLIFALGEESTGTLLPALRTLHIVGICDTSQSLSELFIPMLRYRKSASNGLTELKFDACGASIAGDLDTVEEYVEVLKYNLEPRKVACHHTWGARPWTP